MSSEWQNVPLGAFLKRRTEQPTIHPDEVYSRLTMAINGKGVRLRDRVRGRELGTAKYVARSGDLMISKIDARKGAAAVLPDELDGVIVTGDFLPFVVSRGVADPAFLDLVVRTPDFARKCDLISGGTTNRVRLDVKRLPELTLMLPPLEVQRRIVGLVEVVDAHLASLSSEIGALTRLLRALLDEWHAQGAAVAGLPLLGDLAVIRSGPSWAADEESGVPSDGATRVIKITNTKQDGSLDLTGRTYVTGLPARTLLLDDRSLIVIRTNGNRDRIGNVYRPSPEAFGCAVSAFQFIVHAVDGVARDRIYWALRAPRAQAAMSEAASGSTGLGNLAAGWLKERPIAELDGQSRLAFEDADRQLALLRNEREGLGAVRTQLLQALLSHEMEIPESYDLLLDAGVA